MPVGTGSRGTFAGSVGRTHAARTLRILSVPAHLADTDPLIIQIPRWGIFLFCTSNKKGSALIALPIFFFGKVLEGAWENFLKEVPPQKPLSPQASEHLEELEADTVDRAIGLGDDLILIGGESDRDEGVLGIVL